jgi:hypothetical protein
MKIIELNSNLDLEINNRLSGKYEQFNQIILELRKKDLPDGLVLSINQDIDEINSLVCSELDFIKIIVKKQNRILKMLEKELKLVPKNYYRNLWLGLGMAAFGVPMGVAFSSILGNMAFLSLGIPFGFVIGLSIGISMDKKACEEGRQLDLEINH